MNDKPPFNPFFSFGLFLLAMGATVTALIYLFYVVARPWL